MARSSAKNRRQPWVLMGLIALLLGSSALQQFADGGGSVAADEAAVEALEFYRENVQVEADPRIRRIADVELLDEIEVDRADKRSRSGHRAMPERLRSRTQSRFDALVDRAVEAHVAANPVWSHGVVAEGNGADRIFGHVFYVPSALDLLACAVFLVLTGLALERMLGPIFMAGFSVLAASLGAWTFVVMHGDLGVPWAGPGGIVGGFVGLYTVLAFSGSVIPGWLVLPLWIFVDSFLLRGAWEGGIEALPVYAQASSITLGVVVGLALPLVRKRATADKDESDEERRNATLGCATLMRGSGKPLEALEHLEEELQRDRGQRDVVLACWELALDLRDPQRVAASMIESIRRSVRENHPDVAVQDWLSLVGAVPEAQMETQLWVRLGEMLLDEGHPDRAIDALERSLGASPPLSSVLALRVVRVARDLDSGLTGRAAVIALRDTHLDPELVPELQELAAAASESGADEEPGLRLPEPIAEAPTPMVASIPQVEGARSRLDEDAVGSSEPAEVSTEPAADDLLDPNALTVDRLQRAFEADLPDDFLVDPTAAPTTDEDDVSSLDPNALSESDLLEDTATTEVEGLSDECVEALADTDVDLTAPGRLVKSVASVPLALEPGSLVVDAANRGKSRVPFDRIQALAVGVVAGLSRRPVVVVDLVLNWMDLDEPDLKIIRIRSDGFDPLGVVPDAPAPMDALRSFIEQLLDASDAIPLPASPAVRGRPFANFSDLATYESEVLGARTP